MSLGSRSYFQMPEYIIFQELVIGLTLKSRLNFYSLQESSFQATQRTKATANKQFNNHTVPIIIIFIIHISGHVIFI